jgi:nucleotide-binding universal stress UspA family protein
MNEILVAVDGSKHSFRIVDVACQIAKPLSAGIILVYVMHVPSEEPEGVKTFEKVEQFPDAYSDYLEGLGEEVTGKLSEVIQKAGIPVRAVTPTGNPANEILNVADIENPMLIIVGVKGLHGIARFRSIGSVARNIIENSRVPVVSVPPA